MIASQICPSCDRKRSRSRSKGREKDASQPKMDWSLKLLKSWQRIGHGSLWDQLQIQAAHGEEAFGYSEFIGMGMVDTQKMGGLPRRGNIGNTMAIGQTCLTIFSREPRESEMVDQQCLDQYAVKRRTEPLSKISTVYLNQYPVTFIISHIHIHTYQHTH